MTLGAGDRPQAAVGTLLEAHAAAAGPVGLAVSGGSDSTALLLAAQVWARDRGVALRAATVDHGLRAGSAAEADHVAALAARIGVPHDTLPLSDLRHGPNLQARAREARYAALALWSQVEELRCVLLGHTADDVAETLVLRLRRGAGLEGLARMAAWRPASEGGFAWGRPFLEFRREGLREWLRAQGAVWIDDLSNADRTFDRVRARQAIAALELDPRVLANTARALDDARRTLDARTRVLARAIVREDRGDLLLQTDALAALLDEEPEHPRRILLAALAWVGGGPPPRRATQLRLLDHLRHRKPLTLSGCRVTFAQDGMRIGRELAAAAPPGPTDRLWDGRWCLDGPHAPDLSVGALGDDVDETDWRSAGLPRASAMASPAVRRGPVLLAAPLAGRPGAWTARPRVPFAQAPIGR